MTKTGLITAKWSGNDPYTLTASFVASDEIVVDFTKRLTLFPAYKGGAGGTTNVLSYQVQFNPLNATQDPSGLYWATYGIFTDSSGTWSEEAATYTSTQTTAGTYKAGVPLVLGQVDAQRMRILVKETVNAGAAGVVRVQVDTNDIL